MSEWWEGQCLLYFGNSESKKFNNNINALIRNGPELYESINNYFSLNKSKSIKGEIIFWYDSPYNENIYRYEQSYSLDLALTFNSLIKNFKFTTGVYDVFASSPKTKTSTVNNISQNHIAYGYTRFFRVTLIYDFGNKNISSKERKVGNEEEKRRSN